MMLKRDTKVYIALYIKLLSLLYLAYLVNGLDGRYDEETEAEEEILTEAQLARKKIEDEKKL